MTTHHLKAWPAPFADLAAGVKSYEIRINDRNYRAGDRLVLREWDPTKQTHTGSFCIAHVTHVTSSSSYGGILDGMLGTNVAVLGIQLRAVGRWPEFVATDAEGGSK